MKLTGCYADAVILNQLLYNMRELSSGYVGMTIYELHRSCSFRKSLRSLRNRLSRLIDKGLVVRTGNSLYGMLRYRPAADICVNDKKLAALIEVPDMRYGDYQTAGVLNFFRERVLEGKEEVEISARELCERLSLDRSRQSIRSRLQSLESMQLIKCRLNGRIYKYELDSSYILNGKSPEAIITLGKRLSRLFDKHLTLFGMSSVKNNVKTFERMLYDGYDYLTTCHIVAHLGMTDDEKLRKRIRNAADIRKNYEELYELSFLLKESESNKYLEQLDKGELQRHLKPQEKSAPLFPDAVLSESERAWSEVGSWCEQNKNLVYYFFNYNKLIADDLIEGEDILSELKSALYNYVMQNGTPLSEMTQQYIRMCVKGLAIKHKKNIRMRYFYENEAENLPEGDEVLENLYEPDWSDMPIPEQFKDIPEQTMRIVIDSLQTDLRTEGRLYSQRDLAKKYGMSLGKINGLLKKYRPIVEEIALGKSEPPDDPPEEDKSEQTA